MKKLIRLTEQDLHRIVKESVNKILNEVQFGGESLHGNNPEDWYAMRDLRRGLAQKAAGDAAEVNAEGDDYAPGYFENLAKADRNSSNASSIYDREGGNDIYSQEFIDRVRKDDANGQRKAARISKRTRIPTDDWF